MVEAVYTTGQAVDIRHVMAAVVPEGERVLRAMEKVIYSNEGQNSIRLIL